MDIKWRSYTLVFLLKELMLKKIYDRREKFLSLSDFVAPAGFLAPEGQKPEEAP